MATEIPNLFDNYPHFHVTIMVSGEVAEWLKALPC
tara:strand:- start:5 stop:109 length:105 start_codon:yes stop_codon:yes gene_type:complete